MEELDAVGAVVGHGDLPGRADGDAAKFSKLPVAASPGSELEVERAVWVEELDGVADTVGHSDLPGRADGDVVMIPKLEIIPVVVLKGSELKVERAVWVEDIDGVTKLSVMAIWPDGPMATSTGWMRFLCGSDPSMNASEALYCCPSACCLAACGAKDGAL